MCHSLDIVVETAYQAMFVLSSSPLDAAFDTKTLRVRRSLEDNAVVRVQFVDEFA
jgi:hypothetical protein